MITVKILADSINPAGVRITSWLLTYPRFIHSEFMTHRIFSRNAASSRAIPLKKMLEAVQSSPALPERWGAEQKGMQSGAEIPLDKIEQIHERGDGVMEVRGLKPEWETLGDYCALKAKHFSHTYGLHKSLCNRLIEPWSHITVLATATDHRNFFALRAHPDAMPEFQVLAYRMLDAYLKSQPRQIQWGEWHIPAFAFTAKGEDWIDNPAYAKLDTPEETSKRLKIATARCARLSYLTFDGDHSPEKDIELHDRLLTSGHMSPFEHCAMATNDREYPWSNFDNPLWNTTGLKGMSYWLQYRKRFENENRTNVDLDQVLSSKPDWITL